MTDWKARRFWTRAEVGKIDEGFAVLLDGRSVNTPSKRPLVVPTEALAEAVAAEWAAQREVVDPLSMPVTRAASSAVDKVAPQRDAIVEDLALYADSDLTCYRAERPAELAARQAAAWDPLLDWAAATYRARLMPVAGVVHIPQNPASLDRLRRPVAEMSDFELTALSDLVALSGSLIVGLAAMRDAFPPDELWRRSRIDEIWQVEQWGYDEEAAAAAEARETAFSAAWRFRGLLKNKSVR